MIQQHDEMPKGELQQLLNGEMLTHQTSELFANKKVVLFAFRK